jgi:predicted secreted protein
MEPIVLPEGDAGRVVEVARGQTVVIRLSSNRSTGYRWTLMPATGGVLTAFAQPVYTPAGAPGGKPGSGGYRNLVVRSEPRRPAGTPVRVSPVLGA